MIPRASTPPTPSRPALARRNSVAALPSASTRERRLSLVPQMLRQNSLPPTPDARPRRGSVLSTVAQGPKEKGVNVVVCVRCRPPTAAEQRVGTIVECDAGAGMVSIRAPSKKTDMVVGSRGEKVMQYDHVFDPQATQEEVYNKAVSPLVQEFIRGFNTTVFAYGQTGAGKTYTMEGSEVSTPAVTPSSGVIQRAICEIFDRLSVSSAEYSMQVSCVELYNEDLIDLMSTTNEKLRIYDTQEGGITVKNIEEKTVYSVSDTLNLVARCHERRHVAETLMNAASSRSHCLFTIQLNVTEADDTDENVKYVRTSKLNLVDLAGSECVGRSGGSKSEAGRINQSLLTLGRVIQALSDNSGHVPFRESNLTRLLKDSLGGGTRTCMIANISPSASAVEETLSTLEYATRARCIVTRPEISKRTSPEEMILKLQRELERLKSEQADGDVDRVRLLSGDIDRWRVRAEQAEGRLSSLENEVETLHRQLEQMKAENDELKGRSMLRRHSIGAVFEKENDAPLESPPLMLSEVAPSTPTTGGFVMTPRRKSISTPTQCTDGSTCPSPALIAPSPMPGLPGASPSTARSSSRRRSSITPHTRMSLQPLTPIEPVTPDPFAAQVSARKRIAFLAFVQHVRLNYDTKGMSAKEFARRVSLEWKQLPEEQKRQYKMLALA